MRLIKYVCVASADGETIAITQTSAPTQYYETVPTKQSS